MLLQHETVIYNGLPYGDNDLPILMKYELYLLTGSYKWHLNTSIALIYEHKCLPLEDFPLRGSLPIEESQTHTDIGVKYYSPAILDNMEESNSL